MQLDQKEVVDIPWLTRKLAALSLDDKPIYPDLPRPSKTPVTRFFKRMSRSRSPKLKEHGYKGVQSKLRRSELHKTYNLGLENYQMVHLERYIFIYGKPQYVFEGSLLEKYISLENIEHRQTSKWYSILRTMADEKDHSTTPLSDPPSDEIFRDWTYRVDQDSTDNTLELLDRFAAWDITDDAIIGDSEYTPNVLVTRRIAIEDLLLVKSRLTQAHSELVPHIKLAIKAFLEIEFDIVDCDF
ncbi:hypothetical protein F4781DRAFT_435527 [Annulohypoxylon bovei var. microspora]|nr:hypothetical protein F4781DRAFT_435527 [Annulohypoxylon bovei var. microspora]